MSHQQTIKAAIEAIKEEIALIGQRISNNPLNKALASNGVARIEKLSAHQFMLEDVHGVR
jgi:hypothetical protein